MIKRGVITLLLLFVALCSKAQSSAERMKIVEKPSHIVEAPSVEYDPHFWSQNIIRRGYAQSVWEDIFCRRVSLMGIKRMRVMLMPAWYEPENDNSDPNKTDWSKMDFSSLEMESLHKLLDLAEQKKIEITLTMWGCHRYWNGKIHFLAEGNTTDDWCVPSKHHEEWAENISVALQWLLLKRGYTCIKEFTLMNEPSWAYKIDGEVDKDHYTEMCHILDKRLRSDGVRDLLRFNLSDDAENIDFLRHSVERVNDVADCYNSHTYKFGYSTPNSEIEAWQKANIETVAPTGKRHFIGEFGSNENVGSSRQRDIDRYERGVLMTRIALMLMNSGAAGVSYWSLLDQYYSPTDPYGSMQQLGLWLSAKREYEGDEKYEGVINEDFEPRPQYYAYSLLTRHLGRGEIFPLSTNNEFVAASAFKREDGKWVYVVANGSAERFSSTIDNPHIRKATFERYHYSQATLPTDDSLIASDLLTKARRGNLEIMLEPQTMVLFVER